MVQSHRHDCTFESQTQSIMEVFYGAKGLCVGMLGSGVSMTCRCGHN